jgi:hypothetical protein
VASYPWDEEAAHAYVVAKVLDDAVKGLIRPVHVGQANLRRDGALDARRFAQHLNQWVTALGVHEPERNAPGAGRPDVPQPGADPTDGLGKRICVASPIRPAQR